MWRTALVFSVLGLLACSDNTSTTDGGNSGDSAKGPTTCNADYDCPSGGDHCYFPADGGCSLQGNKGVCQNFTAQLGCTPNVACGCDGTTISVCAPGASVDRPSNFPGACPLGDAGVEAGDDSGDDAASGTDASPE